MKEAVEWLLRMNETRLQGVRKRQEAACEYLPGNKKHCVDMWVVDPEYRKHILEMNKEVDQEIKKLEEERNGLLTELEELNNQEAINNF